MNNIPNFTFTRQRLLPGFDGKECKVSPRLVKIEDNVFISYTMLLLTGSDVFYDSYVIKSTDGGNTFASPEKLDRLETVKDGIRTIFTPTAEHYSEYYKKWFVFGRSTSYDNDNGPLLPNDGGKGMAQCILRDNESGQYTGDIISLPVPMEYDYATPHGQVIEYENGDFLLTFYVTPRGELREKALAVRYRYENGEFLVIESGKSLALETSARGLAEPSVAEIGGKYYMTLRTDEQGLFAVSDNGFDYSEPKPWKWDDGKLLENYNTMQRWIRHRDSLYLTYTRRGAKNDHVFRHRAPIFMARFDEKQQCLVKDTEIILVPELGARLGNFAVTDISDKEFWFLTAEWMQPIGCEKYGSDNSIWLVKISFE